MQHISQGIASKCSSIATDLLPGSRGTIICMKPKYHFTHEIMHPRCSSLFLLYPMKRQPSGENSQEQQGGVQTETSRNKLHPPVLQTLLWSKNSCKREEISTDFLILQHPMLFCCLSNPQELLWDVRKRAEDLFHEFLPFVIH